MPQASPAPSPQLVQTSCPPATRGRHPCRRSWKALANGAARPLQACCLPSPAAEVTPVLSHSQLSPLL